jgi:hypothetical protein
VIESKEDKIDRGPSDIQPRRPPLDLAQQQMRYGIEGHDAKLQGLPHRVSNFSQPECFQQAQHLHKLPLAAFR